MRLTSLQLQGFKSFADKTTLSFGEGITAVVGPNGSGKSNISDAVRWVLGEQSSRQLRGERMEDVIFVGASSRRPLGFAEVSLTIDNSDRGLAFDGDEVRVTRRYYRSGESEYLLNGAAVRLRDIHELFMDTGLGRDGYSVIGQGRIADIVASRSDERREIFEEAAGISKYRYRRTEAQRRLSAAQENLLRLLDILKELEERIGPLEKQAEKAEKFLALSGEKKSLELSVFNRRLLEQRQAAREIEHKLLTVSSQHEAAAGALEAIEKEIEKIQEDTALLSAQADELRRGAALYEEQAADCRREADVLENTREHNSASVGRLERELELSRQSEQQLRGQMDERRRQGEEYAAAARELTRQLEEKNALALILAGQNDALVEESEKLANERAQLQTREADLRIAAAAAKSESGAADERIRLAREAADTARESLTQFETEKKEFEEGLRALEERIVSLGNMEKGYEARRKQREAKALEAKKLADRLTLDAQETARRAQLLEELERNLEGFAYSVKAVMRQARQGALKGIIGPVSQLLEADEDTTLALETALGGAMQHIVAENEAAAKSAIAFLKRSDGGRATFLPISSVHGTALSQPGLSSCRGFVGMAHELVRYDERYRGIVISLLGRTAVAEDLDCAVEIARRFDYKFRVVTLDGQVVNAGGSMTGGSNAKNAHLLGRKAEIARIREEAAALGEKAKRAKEEESRFSAQLSESVAQMTGIHGELATASEDKIRFEAELRRVEAQAKTAEQSALDWERQLTEFTEKIERLRHASEQADAELQELARLRTKNDAENGVLLEKRAALSEEREKLTEACGLFRMDIIAAQKDEQAANDAARELESRIGGQSAHADDLTKERELLLKENEELLTRRETLAAREQALKAQASGAEKEIEALRTRQDELSAQFSALRRDERERSDERERLGRELARLNERKEAAEKETEDCIRSLWEEYEMTRSEAEAAAQPAEDLPAAQRRLGQLRSSIRALGSVNVGAVEEFREVRERYDFLHAQLEDVQHSKAELERLITELTGQMHELFTDRFARIGQQFSSIFTELFGGGKASLKLTDPNDVLSSGIEIAVQPPGKIITHLDSLSGGEKSLCAIALYFAILRVSPAPFCILDEIEAALDDVNVTRFASYLRRMSDRTQFIAITHRRGTMEEADVLYGVTMQEEGVSKLLEMKTTQLTKEWGVR